MRGLPHSVCSVKFFLVDILFKIRFMHNSEKVFLCISQCHFMKFIDNTKIEIKQRNNALECLIAGIKTNSSFSWTHYSQHGNHLHCHDRIGSVLNLSEYKPFEREGLYTCTATFHGGTNDVILQTSVRVTDEGMTLFFQSHNLKRHMHIWSIFVRDRNIFG